MELEELKKIPITSLLSHLGYHPVHYYRGNTQYMYRSPLHEDTRPSFSVSVRKNIWNDFGLGKGGNVIDLAIELNGNCTFHKAVTWLEEQYSSMSSVPPEDRKTRQRVYLNPKRAEQSEFRDVRVEPLRHHALLSYLLNRGIPLDIAVRHCGEVHYTVYQKEYFGICFQNILGGMEIRNAFFKGCYKQKAPSVIPFLKGERTGSCCVFEGFMDFLSYLALERNGRGPMVVSEYCDCIVLNSTALVQKAIPFIEVYEHAYCYFDNDAAGYAAFESVRNRMSDKATLMSELYRDYNDLNDYLNNKPSRRKQ